MDIKSAWIYCSIDAPEDTHGILKGQYERLETYASQMDFAVVGSSQDLGSGLHFDRPGLRSVLEAAKNESFQVLLVDSVSRIGRDEATIKTFIKKLMSYGVTVFSPLEGKILV
jgi:DNA invertase Pin-like site-specific DNA recombinase